MPFEQLDELFDYKNQLMQDLLTNKDIVNLINDELDFSKATSLAYTQVICLWRWKIRFDRAAIAALNIMPRIR